METYSQEIYLGISALVAILVVIFGIFLFKKKKPLPPSVESKPDSIPSAPETIVQPLKVEMPAPEPVVAQGPAWNQKLEKTRSSLFGKLDALFGKSKAEVLPKEWDAIEEALLEGDVGFQATTLILSKVKEELAKNPGAPLAGLVTQTTDKLFSTLSHGEIALDGVAKPYVISVVGINGAGKTTTVGKLASLFEKKGKKVLMGAVDTFRAGAIDQLKVWSERSGAQFVTGREGADPGAVAFDSVTAGKARGVDIVLLDTAGRLHTKSNLMDELKKIDRVIKKVIPEAPHETWLVIDGTLGQNSIQQAKEFQKALPLTGVIVTKLDGTAKGGALLSIVTDLKLPIRYVGLGEQVEDLIAFEPKPFIEAILG